MSLDFRRADRADVVISATADGGNGSFDCTIRDLSAYGCFVSTEEALPAGSPVKLAWREAGHAEELHVAGTVIRRAGRKDDHIGFGVEFEQSLGES